MYIQLTFHNISNEQKEILIAKLYEVVEGFEEGDTFLTAIIEKENFTGEIEEMISGETPAPEIEELPQQNWNALWESNFEPVIVDNFVAVRADFHPPVKNVEHEILITPKMSFGTGHHATTYLMMQQMREVDFSQKSVFDFGTGTGILAILAKKIGAAKVIATDIDNWSIENAAENFSRNGITDIELRQSSDAGQGCGFDVILANINKNVLLETIPRLAKSLSSEGILLLSGLLAHDKEDIENLCKTAGLQPLGTASRNGWIILIMKAL